MHDKELMIFSVALVLGLLLYSFEVHWWLAKIHKKNPSPWRKKMAPAMHAVAAAGTVCLLYSAFIEPQWSEVKRITIQTEKPKKTRLKIVQISDLHCHKKIRNE